MIAQCPIHDVYMEERQSKTKFDEDGNPKTYWGHMANGKMCFGKPERANSGYQTPAPQLREAVKQEQPDWDAISRGKVRHGVAVAFIGQGVNAPTEDIVLDMEKWVDYIMSGPKTDEF